MIRRRCLLILLLDLTLLTLLLRSGLILLLLLILLRLLVILSLLRWLLRHRLVLLSLRDVRRGIRRGAGLRIGRSRRGRILLILLGERGNAT